jgi:phage tail sheath protein FI
MVKKKPAKPVKKPSGTYLSPGVYMEEVSSGSKPIEGVGTAVAAFVGFAAAFPRRHPVGTALTLLALIAAVAVVRSGQAQSGSGGQQSKP